MEFLKTPLPKRLDQISEITDQKILDYTSLLGDPPFQLQMFLAIVNGPRMGFVDGWFDFILDENGNPIEEIAAVIVPITDEFFGWNYASYGFDNWVNSKGLARAPSNGGYMFLRKTNDNTVIKPAGQNLNIPIKTTNGSNYLPVMPEGPNGFVAASLTVETNDSDWIYVEGNGIYYDFHMTANLINPNGEQEYIKIESQIFNEGSGTWADQEFDIMYYARSVKGRISMSGNLGGWGNTAKRRFRFVLCSDSANAVTLDYFMVNFKTVI